MLSVSVVMPTFNCRTHISEAIESVLRQDYSALELLVIDDGSTDGTGDLVKSRYPGVKYFCQDNAGVSCARNVGIHESRGDLVAFLDADDVWESDKLRHQVELFERSPEVGLVFSDNIVISVGGCFLSDSTHKRVRLLEYGDAVRNIFLSSGVLTSSVVVRRSVLESVGGFEESLEAAEDDNLWMRVASKYKIEMIDLPLVRYRRSAGSLSRSRHKIYRGVKESVDILSRKYPEVYCRIADVAPEKLMILELEQGYYEIVSENHRGARVHLLKSLSRKFTKMAVMLLVASFFPVRLVRTARALRRKLILRK